MKDIEMIEELWTTINDRADHPSPDSYVSSVLTHRKGIDKSLEKFGEEATEFILAVKNGKSDRTVEETADLLYHLLVALRAANVDLSDVMQELGKRRK